MYRLHILIHTVQMQIVSGTHYYDKRSFQCRHDYNCVLKYFPTAKSRQKACISLQTEFIPTLEQIRTRLQHFPFTSFILTYFLLGKRLAYISGHFRSNRNTFVLFNVISLYQTTLAHAVTKSQ